MMTRRTVLGAAAAAVALPPGFVLAEAEAPAPAWQAQVDAATTAKAVEMLYSDATRHLGIDERKRIEAHPHVLSGDSDHVQYCKALYRKYVRLCS